MTKVFSFRQPFLDFYSGPAKDIDNDNNNRFYDRNRGRKTTL